MTAMMAAATPAHAEPFQRAISLSYDLLYPKRIAHFRPTAKSIRVIRAIQGLLPGRAFMVIAAYGTGKSISATFAAQAVMNADHACPLLTSVSERMKAIDNELATAICQRTQERHARGIVIALEGYQDNLVAAFCTATYSRCEQVNLYLDTSLTSPVEILSKVIEAVERQGIDRIAVIWDEFGRHLEGLVAQGQAGELATLQQLAELAGRTQRITVTLTLLLHQGFFQYAGSLPQTIRNEWKKIEGRFEVLQYVDDSREMYALLADVVQESRPAAIEKTSGDMTAAASQAKTLGFFRMFATADDLAEVLARAYPLTPATLYMLPRLAARAAQNERTLFSFLHEIDLAAPVTLADLYDTFAPAMRADTTLGGTYRHWLETESALSKAESVVEAHLLKAACLLSLGLSGQRLRVSRDTLAFAVSGVYEDDEIQTAIEHLITRKLLLYRRHGDDVSIWHGTDADLRGRLEDEKARLAREFDLAMFLRREYPAPIWLPAEHNGRYLIRRYYTGDYVEAAELLQAGADHPVFQLQAGEDGRVIYPLVDDEDTLDRLRVLAATTMPVNQGIVLALSRNAMTIRDTALELWCLTQLQQDPILTGADPLVLPELQQMADDVRRYLASLMERLLIPALNGPHWFCGRSKQPIVSRGQLRSWLSELADKRYPLTPKINNESVVRHRLSRPMVNARKKVILGLLERSDQPHFGFAGTTPDASIYRTVLRHTHLVHEDETGVMRFARPHDLMPGLKEIWKRIEAFLSEPSATPKKPGSLLKELQEPPFGARAGVLPILFAAGLRAFPAAISIYRQGRYLSDLLPTDIEELCRNPDSYTITVHAIDEERQSYLAGLYALFAEREITSAPHQDVVRDVYDALETWKAQLPAAALSTSQVSREAQVFQRLIRRIDDPAALFLERLPALASSPSPGLAAPLVLEAVQRWRDELTGVIGGYERTAATAICQVLCIDPLSTGGDSRQAAAHWGRCFSDTIIEQLDMVNQAFVRITRTAETEPNEPTFINKLASILISKSLNRWDDQTPEAFRRALREAVATAEEAALATDENSPGAINLAQGRLQTVYRRLVELAGDDAAKTFLSILKER